MAKLIALADIPHCARSAERAARNKHACRGAALAAATYEIVLAPGCYSGAYAPTVGWCCSRDAAEALSERLTHMPGGTSHSRLRWQCREVV